MACYALRIELLSGFVVASQEIPWTSSKLTSKTSKRGNKNLNNVARPAFNFFLKKICQRCFLKILEQHFVAFLLNFNALRKCFEV